MKVKVRALDTFSDNRCGGFVPAGTKDLIISEDAAKDLEERGLVKITGKADSKDDKKPLIPGGKTPPENKKLKGPSSNKRKSGSTVRAKVDDNDSN